jgi:hypothetical protein
MRLFLFLSSIGALVGCYPGSFLAFFLAAGTDSAAEAVCYFINVVLSVGGASAGLLITRAIQRQEKIRVLEVVLSVVLGLLFGTGGYLWLDCAISHADPPL